MSDANIPTASPKSAIRHHPWIAPFWRALRTQPSAILFAVQMVGIIVYPLMTDSTLGRAAFNAFGIMVAMLALWSVRVSPGLNWVGALLALPAASLLTIGAFVNNADLQAASSAFEALLYLYAAGCMLAYMLADHKISADELWAVGATFTLLAWAFAHSFMVCQTLAPLSFTAAADPETPRTFFELLFLSITTLTTTGLSDIVPIRSAARVLVLFEELVGLGYVVMLVSRVVGLTVMSKRV